ncbi:pyruvate kinase-like protein [Fusarium venenatum]|uniref:pyruvate kinase-like protein n=1 Tax=Fusarium venenatum TaxID=56646 RepID=UPI001D9C23BB|nr:pyruvate kinase-like protein [Fusarium venenatum]
MGVPSTRNIPKENVFELQDAPIPETGVLLQVRAGKVKERGLAGEITSAIYKQEQHGPTCVTVTGILGDEHAAKSHGGTERAVHQYNPEHYPDWQAEDAPEPGLYDIGTFGENLVATNMNDDNVCIGDIYKLGDEVVLEVSEPRHPCFKLNSRFKWPRALKRTIRTGRSGWNFRVLQTGNICKGDTISLIKRPYPKWSVLNVQRILRARNVSLQLLAESIQLPMPEMWIEIGKEKLRNSPKTYTLVEAQLVTSRVRNLTFRLKDDLKLDNPEFDHYGFAQITFGPDNKFERSYSIVDGDLYTFSLGISLDRNSRGGSAYIHKEMKTGDEIQMSPGNNLGAQENDKKADPDLECILIVGGIGITAFLPSIREWEAKGQPYHLHYAVPSPNDAPFLHELPRDKTTLYAKSEGQRLNISEVIPQPTTEDKTFPARIFSCGPGGMMKECQRITSELGYPEHLVHFEDFGSGGDNLGEPFEVEVQEFETNRHETMTVPSNKTLLDVLNEAGFDVLYSCKFEKEKGTALQACVDRGVGKLAVEID